MVCCNNISLTTVHDAYSQQYSQSLRWVYVWRCYVFIIRHLQKVHTQPWGNPGTGEQRRRRIWRRRQPEDGKQKQCYKVSRGTLLSTMWKVVFGFTTKHILKTKQLIKNRRPAQNISKHDIKRAEAIRKKTLKSSKRFVKEKKKRFHQQWCMYLHGGDDHASVHHKLTQRCGALVAVSAVNHKQTANVLKLSDGKVCGQRCLLPLLFEKPGI